MGIYDVPPAELIERTAKELQKDASLKPPEWAMFVKTGHFKQRPPASKDWWHIRAAAVLRKIAMLQPVGTQKLRVKFGGRKHRGVAGEHFKKASGNIIRKIFQQLDKAGLTKVELKKLKRGRVLTGKGASLLEKVSQAIMKEKNIVLPKRPEGVVLHLEKPAKKTGTEKAAEEKKPKPARKRAPTKKKTGTEKAATTATEKNMEQNVEVPLAKEKIAVEQKAEAKAAAEKAAEKPAKVAQDAEPPSHHEEVSDEVALRKTQDASGGESGKP